MAIDNVSYGRLCNTQCFDQHLGNEFQQSWYVWLPCHRWLRSIGLQRIGHSDVDLGIAFHNFRFDDRCEQWSDRYIREQRVLVAGFDQFGNAIAATPSMTYTVVSGPTGGTVSASNATGGNSLTFNKLGTFTVRARNGSVQVDFQANVTATLTSYRVTTPTNQTLTTSPLSIGGTTQNLTATGLDQFGGVLASQPTITWESVSSPSGGSITIGGSNNSLAATFTRAGAYVVRAVSGSVATNYTLNVTQTLTTISLSTSSGSAIDANNGVTISGRELRVVVKGYDQFGNLIAATPTTNYSVVSGPTGGTVTAANATGGNTLTFNKLGTFTVRARSGNATVDFQVVVSPTLSSFRVSSSDNRVLSASPLTANTTSITLTATGLDQYSGALNSQPTITWSLVSAPSSGNATLSPSGNSVAVTFTKVGTYVLRATSGSTVTNYTILVSPALTTFRTASIDGTAVDPNVAVTVAGASVRFALQGFDQFGDAMTTLPSFTWSTTSAPTGGSLSATPATGYVTLAFNKLGTFAVRGRSGSVTFDFSVNVQPVLSSIRIQTPDSRAITATGVSVTGTSQALQAIGLDQFGGVLSSQPEIDWSVLSAPTGGTATLNESGKQHQRKFGSRGNVHVSSAIGQRQAYCSAQCRANFDDFPIGRFLWHSDPRW